VNSGHQLWGCVNTSRVAEGSEDHRDNLGHLPPSLSVAEGVADNLNPLPLQPGHPTGRCRARSQIIDSSLSSDEAAIGTDHGSGRATDWRSTNDSFLLTPQPATTMVTSTTTQLSFKAEDLPIKSVTVFRPSGAQIIRILKANLKVCQRLRAPSSPNLARSTDLITPNCYTGWE